MNDSLSHGAPDSPAPPRPASPQTCLSTGASRRRENLAEGSPDVWGTSPNRGVASQLRAPWAQGAGTTGLTAPAPPPSASGIHGEVRSGDGPGRWERGLPRAPSSQPGLWQPPRERSGLGGPPPPPGGPLTQWPLLLLALVGSALHESWPRGEAGGGWGTGERQRRHPAQKLGTQDILL